MRYAACILLLLAAGTVSGQDPPPAAGDTPIAPEAIYNQAVELYQRGELDDAARLWRQSLQHGERPLMESRSRYNLGNLAYRRALLMLESQDEGQQDLQPAIAALQDAIDFYRAALRSDPLDHDARVNIELARRLIDSLEAQQEQEQDPDQQQQEDESQSQEDGDEQEQDPQEGEGDPSESDDASEPGEQEMSEEGDDQGEQMSDEMDEQMTDADSEQEPPGDERDDAEADDSEMELNPDDLPDPEEMEGDADEMAMQPTDEMTEEEAAQMLQAVRDRHLQRRIEQMRRQQSQYEPVEQDW